MEFHTSRHIPFFSLRSIPLLCFKTLIKIFHLENGAITLKAVGALTYPTEQRKCPFLKNPMFKEMRVKKVCLFLGPRQYRSSVNIFQLANQIYFLRWRKEPRVWQMWFSVEKYCKFCRTFIRFVWKPGDWNEKWIWTTEFIYLFKIILLLYYYMYNPCSLLKIQKKQISRKRSLIII